MNQSEKIVLLCHYSSLKLILQNTTLYRCHLVEEVTMTMTEHPLIPKSALDKVRMPIAEASGMPNAAYDDPSYFEFERDNVLAKTWSGLLFASELLQPGYAFIDY